MSFNNRYKPTWQKLTHFDHNAKNVPTETPDPKSAIYTLWDDKGH
jgi:hypothetical protein